MKSEHRMSDQQASVGLFKLLHTMHGKCPRQWKCSYVPVC